MSAPFWPPKYYAGLSQTQKRKRAKEIAVHGARATDDPRAYTPFATDAGIQTKTSQYTRKWRSLFPTASASLKEKSARTGVPLRFLQTVYDRGMAAWRTGHRPGATQQQWGYARVHSFLLCGKTHYGPDADVVRAATAASKRARTWFARCAPASHSTQ